MFRNTTIIFRVIFLWILVWMTNMSLYAQSGDSINAGKANHFKLTDSLSTVTITAFQSSGRWQDVPIALSLLSKRALQFTDGSSLVSAFNTVPGVRFEQRSPGSYRLSIRGSVLRSPYGVRNIKTYWDGIPLTDAGGNTYLQSVSPEQLSGAEIIKGPASSLYGANTGGAVLLHSPATFTDSTENHFQASLMTGSDRLWYPTASWQYSSPDFSSNFSYSHQSADGSRAQDTLQKNVWHYNGLWRLNKKQELELLTFYSDLHYQTPGGITLSQLGTDTTAYPAAISQKAAISNKTFFGAAKFSTRVSDFLDNQTALLWSHTDFENPFITNYEKRKESNYGGRTVFTLHRQKGQTYQSLLAGMEWISGRAAIDNYGNNKGQVDTVQYKDRLQMDQKTFFMQGSLQWPGWQLQAGLSAHRQSMDYKRITDPLQAKGQEANTKYLWSPRLSLNYRLFKLEDLHLYMIVSKGFSPPTLAEIHPSDGSFNKGLEPEGGWNAEMGLKGTALQGRIQYDGSVYHFALKNALVRRSSATVDEYYVNAGSTSQQGAELWLKALLLAPGQQGFINNLSLTGSYTYQPYKFIHYQVEDEIYDQHPITGVPKNTAVFTLQLDLKGGFYLDGLLNCNSRTALNDASTSWADSYQLLQAKAGYRFKAHALQMDVYLGADNLLDQAYSLGNDLNAYGGRFYNPAAGRNYFAGLQLSL